ncbi:MAG: S-layer homology domain-containing protein [Firmicutes bacterium]|nr:S-layer homology domain-containing protein [Bacillota bacterium]
MKKRLICMIASSAILISSIFTAYAEEPVASVEQGSLVVKVKKELGALAYPVDVTVTAYDKNGKLTYLDIIPVGTDGKLEFQFYNKGISGDYTFYFVGGTISQTATLNGFIGEDYWVNYVNTVTSLTEGKDAVNLKSTVMGEANLGLDLTEYNALATEQDKDNVFNVMIADYSEFQSAEAVKLAFADAVNFVKCSASGNAKGYYSYAGKALNIPAGTDSEKISVLDEVSQKAQNAVFSAMNTKIKTCSGKKAFANELKYQTLYTVIANAEHYNDVKYVMNAYVDAGILNVKKDMSPEIYKSLMNKNFTSESGIKAAINEVSAPRPSGVGGGVGGGGGGVAVPIPSQASDIKEPEPIKSTDGTLGGKMRFSDMEDAKWALDKVETLCEKGILSGVGDGKFEPHRYVSREEFAKMLCSLGGFEPQAGEIPFNDIPKDSWSYPYICTAYKNGLISGVSISQFSPRSMVTREQAATMLCRMINMDIEESLGTFEFDDDSGISDWAKSAVYSLHSKGIINGRTSKIFSPTEAMTRVEAAVLLFGAGEKVIWEKED